MKRIALLALILISAAQADTLVALQIVPASVNAGDTFDVGVYITPDPSDQINTFSIDLIFSDFLTSGTVTEDGYFGANTFFFSPGTSGPAGPGLNGLVGVSDVLAGSAVDPGPFPDELFDVEFTATQAGTPVMTVGPGSYLQDPIGNNINIVPAAVTSPEPSAELLIGFGMIIIAALARGRRRA